jgi:hypothetical protein
MPNITITDLYPGSIATRDEEFKDELLTFAGDDTFVAGTVLARQSVALAVTPSAITGTGNGTLTAVTVTPSPEVPKPGNWVLRCITTVTNGGVWQLEDPDGAIVASGLTMTVGAGAATVFEAGGLQFTLTDGSTDFAAGAFFTIPVVANGKLVPFNPAGAGGAQRPSAILTYPVSRVGAGDVKIRALIKGTVIKDRLVIDVDGHGNNITDAIVDQLRQFGIYAEKYQQLGGYDQHD